MLVSMFWILHERPSRLETALTTDGEIAGNDENRHRGRKK